MQTQLMPFSKTHNSKGNNPIDIVCPGQLAQLFGWAWDQLEKWNGKLQQPFLHRPPIIPHKCKTTRRFFITRSYILTAATTAGYTWLESQVKLYLRKAPSAKTVNTLVRSAPEVVDAKQTTNWMNQGCTNTFTWLTWGRVHRKVTWWARKKETALLFWMESKSKAVIYSLNSWAQSHRSGGEKNERRGCGWTKSQLCLPDQKERQSTQLSSRSRTPCEKLPPKDSSNQAAEAAANHTAP